MPFDQFKPDKNTIVSNWGIINKDSSDAVMLEIDGFHGSFVNSRSRKKYILISGELEFDVDGEKETFISPAYFEIKPNQKHSMFGKGAKIVCICEPPFDPAFEKVIN